MTVPVVIQECAARAVTRFGFFQAGLLRDVSKCAVAIVMVKDILPVICQEQVIAAIVVVITHTNAIAPAGLQDPGLGSRVGECPVSVIVIEMARGGLAGGETFQARAAGDKNIQPAIVVVVKERNAGTVGFHDISLLIFVSINRRSSQAGARSNVGE